jgi:hypothetical protein
MPCPTVPVATVGVGTVPELEDMARLLARGLSMPEAATPGVSAPGQGGMARLDIVWLSASLSPLTMGEG